MQLESNQPHTSDKATSWLKYINAMKHLTNAGQWSQGGAELLDKCSNFVGRRVLGDPVLQEGHLQHHHHFSGDFDEKGYFDQINANVTELSLPRLAWTGW